MSVLVNFEVFHGNLFMVMGDMLDASVNCGSAYRISQFIKSSTFSALFTGLEGKQP
jgi:hypothetical protein